MRSLWPGGSAPWARLEYEPWQYQGFIEDSEGWLRPQTHQELVFCVGCHSGIGATTDSNFSFARKLAYGQVNYFSDNVIKSPSAAGMSGMVPYEGQSAEFSKMVDEYTGYLQQNHALNDFRNIGGDMSLPMDKQRILSLLWPSAENAILMNKAYRIIVQQQSYTRGRDAVVSPLADIHQQVEKGEKTGIQTSVEAL